MNMPIEYILRHGKIEQMLSLPCSLFLENKKKQLEKIILTLTPGYGNNLIVVRRYNLSKTITSDRLPSYEECLVPKEQVFSNSNIVIENYKLLEFKQQPFDCEEKQVAEFPMSVVQEARYNDHISNFFNPKTLNRFRENWLWQCFYDLYVPIEVRIRYSMNSKPETNRDMINRNNKLCLNLWEVWKKTLLLNSNPASELVFAKYYKSEFIKKRMSLRDILYHDIMNELSALEKV